MQARILLVPKARSQTVTALRQQCPGTKILILTAYDSDATVRGLISAGAVGYILKDEAPQKVVRAIRTVLQGDTWFSRAIVDKMKRLGIGEQAAVASPVLTERETQMLLLVVKGKTNAAIANELSIAEPTVRFHLRSLYDKIGVRSRTEAAIWAVEHGWGSGKQDEPIGSDSLLPIASDRSELSFRTLLRGGRMPHAGDATGNAGEYLKS